MRALTTLVALLGSAPALAADLGGTFQVELGTIHNSHPAYDLFSDYDGMPSRGIRGGVRVGENLSLLAGWHRVRRGAEVSIAGPSAGGYTTYYDYYDSEDYVVMAFFADEFSAGIQAGVPLGQVVYPYVAVDGMLMRGVMKIDVDTNTKKNPNQLKAQGWAPGLLTLGGIELRTPTKGQGWQLAAFSEFGHSWFLSTDYGEFGPMQVGGFTARGGIGLRF